MRLLLPWLFGLSLVQAQPINREIIIDTHPKGAQIYDQFNSYLGQSGKPLLLNLDKYGTTVRLDLKLSGYQPGHLNIELVQLANRKSWPPQPLELKQQGGALPFYVAGGIGLLGLAAYARQRTRYALSLPDTPSSLPDAGSLAGSVLGRFRLLQRVGAGGMATVYRALPQDSDRPEDVVAVKVMRHELLQDPEMAARFQREVKVTAALAHPHIVRIEDYGQQGQLAYLAIEWIDGGTLKQRFGNHSVALPDIWSALSPICSALHYAHSQGIVHRDLKPENIMITRTGILKVTDFGLARMGDEDRVTATGAVLGTPAYMAPEQIQGSPPSTSMDQYAVGMIAYEMLTGRLPFDEQDPVQLIFKTVSEIPPPPSQFRELSPQIDRVILTMLAKRPEQRYPNLEVAAQHLKGCLLG